MPVHRPTSIQEAIEIAAALFRGDDRESKTNCSGAATSFSAFGPKSKISFKRTFRRQTNRSGGRVPSGAIRADRPVMFFRALWRYIRR